MPLVNNADAAWCSAFLSGRNPIPKKRSLQDTARPPSASSSQPAPTPAPAPVSRYIPTFPKHTPPPKRSPPSVPAPPPQSPPSCTSLDLSLLGRNDPLSPAKAPPRKPTTGNHAVLQLLERGVNYRQLIDDIAALNQNTTIVTTEVLTPEELASAEELFDGHSASATHLSMVDKMQELPALLESICGAVDPCFLEQLASMDWRLPHNREVFLHKLAAQKFTHMDKGRQAHLTLYTTLAAEGELSLGQMIDFTNRYFPEVDTRTTCVFGDTTAFTFDTFLAYIRGFDSHRQLLSTQLVQQQVDAAWRTLGGQEDKSGTLSAPLVCSNAHLLHVEAKQIQSFCRKRHLDTLSFSLLTHIVTHQTDPSPLSPGRRSSSTAPELVKVSKAALPLPVRKPVVEPLLPGLTEAVVAHQSDLTSEPPDSPKQDATAKLDAIVSRHGRGIADMRDHTTPIRPTPYMMHSRIFLRPLNKGRITKNTAKRLEIFEDAYLRDWMLHHVAARATKNLGLFKRHIHHSATW
eukprot:NODE_1180_length_1618_cov_15.380282_g1111_i0.p1 GENE.NODE_1180_length_1618_cov_15.380282_g1111_i0~~NODE_1180_length_1618_cov_15.380282_g1111_i0.p1  ORF type:complete len:518 (-),score=101.15 NODE_1180_length_1618_cov_15.380282_g1111_i0:63-1616(-)